MLVRDGRHYRSRRTGLQTKPGSRRPGDGRQRPPCFPVRHRLAGAARGKRDRRHPVEREMRDLLRPTGKTAVPLKEQGLDAFDRLILGFGRLGRFLQLGLISGYALEGGDSILAGGAGMALFPDRSRRV